MIIGFDTVPRSDKTLVWLSGTTKKKERERSRGKFDAFSFSSPPSPSVTASRRAKPELFMGTASRTDNKFRWSVSFSTIGWRSKSTQQCKLFSELLHDSCLPAHNLFEKNQNMIAQFVWSVRPTLFKDYSHRNIVLFEVLSLIFSFHGWQQLSK